MEVSADGTRAYIKTSGLRNGYIYEIRAEGVRSGQGESILHYVGYYTLNQIPAAPQSLVADVSDSEGVEMEGRAVGEVEGTSMAKRQTEMPATWTEGVDASFDIGTLPGLKFDTEALTVPAGSKVKASLQQQ